MAVFKDAKEIDKVIGGFLRVLGEDPDIAPKMLATNLIFKINYTQPTCVAMVDCSGDKADIQMADTGKKPDIELWMKADVGHNFWRGKVNLPVALATRKIKAKGSVPKLLKLLPIIMPAFKMYPKYLKDSGLSQYL